MTRAIRLQLLILLVLAFPRGGAAAAGTMFTHRHRMKTILPEVKFDKATLEQATRFLSEKARVNIVIDPAVYASTAPAQTPGTLKQPPAAPSPAPAERKTGATSGRRSASDDPTLITLHLKNVPLEVVLKYVLRYKNLRYIVEDYAIVIVPIGRVLPEELQTEVFRLRTGSFDAATPIRPGAARLF
jgi:hypothetical protein